MKKIHVGAPLVAASFILLAGCASDKPAPAAAAPAQTATAPQIGNSAATTGAVAPTPANTNTALARPTASTVYFDYDSYSVKDQYATVVRGNADYLAKSNEAVELDGNADERGSREYNMALGQKRAEAVKKALTALGVRADRIETVSFGEDKPKSNGHDEAAWQENRRVDFVLKK